MSTYPPPNKKVKTVQSTMGNAIDGKALSTHAATAAALQLCNKILKEADEPTLDELTALDVEGDNLTQYFCILATGLGGQENLKSNNEEYSVSTLCKYLEKARMHARNKFPQNCTLCDDDFFRRLKENIPKLTGRRLHKGINEDDVVSKAIPLFRKSNNGTKICVDPKQPHQASGTDLLQIMQALWKSNKSGVHELRAQLNITYSSDGRGGEVKFITYDKMYYDTYFDMPISKWFQQKQISTTATCWTNDYSHPETCVLHSLASFWSVENGLLRGPKTFDNHHSAEYRASCYMFPSTHRMNDTSVAQAQTRKIKELVPASLKSLVSTKCLRIGASTALAADRLVTFDESLARGGWSSHTSRDHYAWVLLAEIVAPMMSLAGHPDPTAMPSPPHLDSIALVDATMVQNYMGALYTISVPFFQPGGKLRDLLEVATATLIMHYPEVRRKYTTQDMLVTKMLQSGLAAKLSGTAIGVDKKLKEWALIIQKDYDRRKCSAPETKSEVINRLVAIQRQAAVANNSLEAKISALEDRQIAMEDKINTLLMMVSSNSASNSSAKVASIDTTKVSPDTKQSGVQQLPQATMSGFAGGGETKSEPGHDSPKAAKKVATINDALMYGAMASQVNADSFAKTRISDVLVKLVTMPSRPLQNLHNKQLASFRYLPVGKSNEKKFVAAMNLADALLSPAMRLCALESSVSASEAKEIFFPIDELVTSATALFEDKATVSSRRQPFWQGVGNVVLKTVGNNWVAAFIPCGVTIEKLKSQPKDSKLCGPTKQSTLVEWMEQKKAALKYGSLKPKP